MSSDLAVVKCMVQMRSGADIEITEEEANILRGILRETTEHKFIQMGKVTINTADVVTVLTPEEATKAEMKRRGMWMCKLGNYHERKEACHCGQGMKKDTGSSIKEAQPMPKNLEAKAHDYYLSLNEHDRRAVDFGAMHVGFAHGYFYCSVLVDHSGSRCSKMEEFTKIWNEEQEKKLIADNNMERIINHGHNDEGGN